MWAELDLRVQFFHHPAAVREVCTVCMCVFADRQDLEDSEKVDVLQEPIVEALKVKLSSLPHCVHSLFQSGRCRSDFLAGL